MQHSLFPKIITDKQFTACNKQLWPGGENRNKSFHSSSMYMKENFQGYQGRLPWGGKLAGSWGCWSLRAPYWEDSGAGLAKYFGFQKSHCFLISAGLFPPIILSFPSLSDFSLHQWRHTKCHLEVISAQAATSLRCLEDWALQRVVRQFCDSLLDFYLLFPPGISLLLEVKAQSLELH